MAKKKLELFSGKFKVGDKVKVLRKAESREGDWLDTWGADMGTSVGKTLEVININKGLHEYELSDGLLNYGYPEFTLELAE